MSNQYSRYPGIPPFTEKDKGVFFGRKSDINRLYNLILTENLVLLQSKSGMGKSSLINAGLIPLLKKKNDVVIYNFRFNNYVAEKSVSPLENMVNTIDEKNKPETFLNKLIPKENSLWYHFKTKQITDGIHLTFYLIFDQFEELFTYPDEYVFAFKKQMADLIYNSLPKNFQIVLNRKQNYDNTDLPTNEEMKQLYMKLDIHVLFAIRADKISEMEKLSDYIPTIRTRFDLQPLKYEQIKEAIVEPARQDGNYSSPKFEFQDEVVDELVQYLTKERTISADTTLLQIICQKFERMVPKGYSSGEFVIEKKQNLPKFEDIVMGFYTDTINLVDFHERVKTQKFLEDEFIKGNQRIPIDELVCEEHIGKKVLAILLNNHLLRTEKNSTGGISYELAHDKLVPPIKDSSEKRRKREADELSEVKRQEELRIANEKAEKDRIEFEKERKRHMKVIRIVSLAALFSLIFAGFGLWGFINATKNEKQLKEATIRYYIRDARANIDNKKYNDAMAGYLYLRDSIMKGDNIQAIEDSILRCQNLIVKQKRYDGLMLQGKKAIEDNNYTKAIDFYIQARNTQINNQEVDLELVKAKNILTERIKGLQEDFSHSDKEIDKIKWRTEANELEELTQKISKLIH